MSTSPSDPIPETLQPIPETHQAPDKPLPETDVTVPPGPGVGLRETCPSIGLPASPEATSPEIALPAGATQVSDPYATRNTVAIVVTPVSPAALQNVPLVAGYEILGELGRGGMGVVYKARQRSLNRLVALKMILSRELAGPGELARFQLEAEAVARLKHPHIVQIYEVGEHKGCPFISLEYVEGGSLDHRVKRTPQPPRLAAELVAVLARAMHYAHENGVVHRDLKPANILLTVGSGQWAVGSKDSSVPASSLPTAHCPLPTVPKIADFGLAKRLDAANGLSHSGAILGTPSYMAPEQAAGHIHEVGPAADTYALAAILYDLLTGRPPFQGSSVLDTLEQVRHKEAPPPSSLQGSVPRDLETICLKGLRKEPRQRYASARALAEDLDRFLEGRPIVARPVSAWERAVKWARRRPAQAALIAALAVAVLAGTFGAIVYGLYQEQRATELAREGEARRKVDELWARADADEKGGRFADAQSNWEQALTGLDGLPSGGDAGLRRRLEEGRDRAHRQLEEEKDRARLDAARRDFQERAARFRKQGDAVLLRTVSFREQDAAEDAAFVRREAPAALAQLDIKPDTAAVGLARYQSAVEALAQLDQVTTECYQVLLAWAMAETMPGAEGTEKEQAARALRLLDAAAGLATAHGLTPPRAYHLRRARCQEVLGDKAAAQAERDRAAASAAETALDLLEDARESYRRNDTTKAAALCEKIAPEDPLSFWALYLKAICSLREKHWLAARYGLDRCLDRSPDSPWLLMHRALAYVGLKENPAAESDFDRALASAGDPAFRAVVLTNRGLLRMGQKRWDDVERDLREAIRLQPDAYQARVILAQAYLDQQKYEAAVSEMDEAIRLHPNDDALYYTRAHMEDEHGDRPAALRDYRQTIVLTPKDGKEKQLASACVQLAHLYHQDKQYEEALASCAAALAAQPNYPPAHLQRADTFLALQHYREAGEALDAYQAAGGSATPKTLVARGLIHMQFGEYAPAVEAFGRALERQRDADTLTYRGWAYLAQEAARPALADFDAALALQPRFVDALSGRGMARAQLGQTAGAVADAEAALREGPRQERLLFRCACVYGRCLLVPDAARDRFGKEREWNRRQDRAFELLQAALEKVPAADGPAYWRNNCQRSPDLVPLRRSDRWLELYRKYSG